MSDYSTNAKINLEVNGEGVAAKLNDLKKQLEELHSKYNDAISRGDKKLQKELSKSLSDVKREIKKIETSSQHAATVLSHLDRATPRELKQTLKILNKELENIHRGSDAWNDHCEKIRTVKEELNKVNATVKLQQNNTEKISNFFTRWQGFWFIFTDVWENVVSVGKQAVQTFADLDTEMANVRKYTGLTADEVSELNEELKKIDTRTSINDLNKLAQEAGRLGKTSKEDVLGFVRAADKINVALDDLGDGATLTISKLTSIFGDEERLGTENAMLAVGSVVNELSQNCSAAAPYLTEFASRLGGVGSQANMTIPQIMSYAAVLDSSNQNVEASATALSQLIVKMMQDPAHFAQATGMEVKEFTDTLKTDTNSALMMFFERLNEIGDMNALAPVFETMKLDGTRATAVLAALSGKVEMLKWEQSEANKAFNEAISVGQEFDVQNNTVQASLDKARKGFTEMAADLGQKLVPVMRYAISSTSALMRVMKIIIDFVFQHKGAIVTLTAAYATYTATVKFNTIVENLHNAAIKTKNGLVSTLTGGIQLLRIAYYHLTGQTRKANVVMTAFNKTAKANPLGLLLSLLTLVVGAITTYIVKTKNATSETQKAISQTKEEINTLDELFIKLQNAKDGTEQRAYLIKSFNDKFGQYHQNLLDEKSTMEDIAIAYNEAKKSLQQLHAEQIREDFVSDASAELESVTTKLTTHIDSWGKKLNDPGRAGLFRRYADDIIAYSRETDAEFSENFWYSAFQRAYHYAKNDIAKSDDEFIEEFLLDKAVSAKGWTVRENKSALKAADLTAKLIDRNNDLLKANKDADAYLQQYGYGNNTDSVGNNNNNNDGVDNNPTAAVIDTPSTPDSKDKFKKEEDWRTSEQFLNRIAFAKGEQDFEEYTSRMEQIDVDFNKKKLDRTDLSNDERLAIEVDYYEALAKQQKTAVQQSADDEMLLYNSILAYEKQRYLDGEVDRKTYNECIRIAELQHLRRMKDVYEEGSQERLDAEHKYQEALIKDKERRAKETEDNEKKHQDALKRIKETYLGLNPNQQKALYDSSLKLLEEAYNQELIACAGNAEEKLRIEKAYQKAKLSLQEEYAQRGGDAVKNASNELAEWLNSEGVQNFMSAYNTLVSGLSSLFSSISSLIQAELDLEVNAIEARYDKEIGLAEGNTYQVKKLEEEKEKEIAKLKNEASKKMYAMQILQAIAQTATNAINAYGSAAAIPVVGFVLGPIAAAMAIAAGAIQIGTIQKQQQLAEAQGYSEGGFTPMGDVDQEVGVVHAGEWVASQKLLKNPVARPLINALDYAQRTNSYGNLRAEDVSRTITAPTVLAKTINGSSATKQTDLLKQYKDTMDKLNTRLDEPFVTINTVTGDAGIKKAQEDYNRLVRNKTPKSRRK